MAGVATTSETNYEHEYTDDTEDFYFTLDVSKYHSEAIPKPSQSTQSRTPKGKQPANAKHTNGLQILDLHSENPLVKLGDSIYSCSWSTDLGTQFYISKCGVAEDPLRRGYVLDVLGMSRARLTGRPVTLHRRRPGAPEKTVGSSTVIAIDVDADDEDQAGAGAASVDTPDARHRPVSKSISRLATARKHARDPLVKAQASFLERLAIIKHQKGETDVVPLHGVEELTGERQDVGTAVITSISNGKRKSVVDGFSNTHASNEPSRKRPMSATGMAQETNGNSPSTHAQPSERNAELSLQQDITTNIGSEGVNTSRFVTSDSQPAVNEELEIGPGPTTFQIPEEQEEGQP